MTRIMRTTVLVAAVLCLAIPVTGQPAQRLDEILEAEEVTVADAAYLAARSADLVGADDDPGAAVDALVDRGLREVETPEDAVRLDELSHMLMVAHELGGGMLYSLLPGRRYAFRELPHQGVFTDGDPNDAVGGDRALRMVGRVLSLVDDS